MGTSQTTLGSLPYWLLTRFAQVLIACITVFLFLEFRRNPSVWQLIASTILLLLYALYLDSCVYGFADEHGVHYRRYFTKCFKPWDQFSRISWFGPHLLSLHLKQGVLFRRELNANSFLSISTLQNLQAEPEFVRWLGVAKPPEADGIQLAPWGQENDVSIKMKTALRAGVLLTCIVILIWLVARVR